ncbi:hypothetical protein [Streptomyces sp. NPDC037389]|uniref:hypothetical protein n=1 Tax=Streptomyces sp. NPDC037389 TaxID=3155369 RepID=UPI0033D72E10
MTLLREAGMSAGDIAACSGVADTLVRRLLRPEEERRPRRILRPTEEALLGIAVPSARTGPRVPGRTPAADAAVRIQQLAQRGWPATYLARQLGTSVHTLSDIRNQRRRHINLRLEQMIRLLHRDLMKTTPANREIPTSHVHRARAAASRTASRVTVFNALDENGLTFALPTSGPTRSTDVVAIQAPPPQQPRRPALLTTVQIGNQLVNPAGLSYGGAMTRLPLPVSGVCVRVKMNVGACGPYAHIVADFEPPGAGVKELELLNTLASSKLPSEYLPALREGLLEGLDGIVASVLITDGTFHEVDSSELGYRIAGAQAGRAALIAAGLLPKEAAAGLRWATWPDKPRPEHRTGERPRT